MPVDTARPVRAKQGQNLEQLMVRYQAADAEAGSDLVEALSRQLFQFFRAQSRSQQDAEDLLQDLWLRVHNARATYRPGEPLLPWLYAIAHRVRIDHYRKAKRVWQHEIADDTVAQNAPSPAPSGSNSNVAAMLQALPDSQRELLLMLKVSGLSLEEAARATGSTIGAVKQKAHRAYEKLRKLLGAAL